MIFKRDGIWLAAYLGFNQMEISCCLKELIMARKRRLRAAAISVGANATGAIALGALAVGAFATGALAVGALAVGYLSIRRLALGKSHIHSLEITELTH